MNNQQRKTLEQVFANPPNGNLEWRKIESLLLAVGCVRTEGALRYRVLDARKFLEAIGVTP